ncbi:MAG: TIGR03668 family PPOX class F420-dependent oxidoreductase [Hyphomicrobiaceae bacterium]
MSFMGSDSSLRLIVPDATSETVPALLLMQSIGRFSRRARTSMLTPEQRRFVEQRRLAHLATADRQGVPHVVPVCFALAEASLYVAIDAKPKRGPATGLKRLRNIAENPAVSIVFDHYDEDWSRLGWVMIHGRAEILDGGLEVADAHDLLRTRYAQYRAMTLEGLPVIAVRVERVAGWGRLD